MSPTRNGNFTSSEIVALTTNGKAKDSLGVPFYTYVEEKNMERRLGRCINNEVDARPTSWGNLCEIIVFNKLGLEYKLISSETLDHPEIECWRGSPDAVKYDDGKTVVDIKCPMTLKSFCQLVDSWAKGGIDAVREGHKEGEKYYWQLVSNAIITNSKFAELIVYVPYKSELEIIKEMASSTGELVEYTKWIFFSNDEQLPYLIEGEHYKNINVMRFEVSGKDKEFLKSRVLAASKMLIKPVSKLIAA